MAPCESDKLKKPPNPKPLIKKCINVKGNNAKCKTEDSVLEKEPLKVVNTNLKPIRTLSTIPKVAPSASTSKVTPAPKSVKKPPLKRCTVPSPKPSSSKKPATSAKKPAWKRRPLPAHSGVPVPEKMRKLQLSLLTMDF